MKQEPVPHSPFERPYTKEFVAPKNFTVKTL